MNQLRLVAGASWREQWRWAIHHLYSLLILSPMVLGMTYVTAVRAADQAPAWQFSTSANVALAALFTASLIALNLSSASAEIYHLRRAEAALEALPLTLATHFHTALVRRLPRTTLVGIVLWIASSLLAGSNNGGGVRVAAGDPLVIAALLLFVVLTAFAETFAALNWIHWGHVRDPRAVIAGLMMLLPAVVIDALLLTAVLRPDDMLAQYRVWIMLGGAAWAALLYTVARVAHARWRATDIEYAKRLQSGGRSSLFGARLLRRKSTPAVAAQIARDLQLTLRVFSSAVYVAAAVAALSVFVLVTVLLTGLLPPASDDVDWFATTWIPAVMAVKLAAVAATVALAALLPVLVAHQIPRRWLERAAGTTGEEMWEAKARYVRFVSLPAPFVVWAAGVATGQVPLFYALPLLGECLWLWWMVSTLFGLLSFEMPDQPGLALILMATISAGAGFSIALLWPLGLVYYVFGIPQLTERGHARAHYHLVQEED